VRHVGRLKMGDRLTELDSASEKPSQLPRAVSSLSGRVPHVTPRVVSWLAGNENIRARPDDARTRFLQAPELGIKANLVEANQHFQPEYCPYQYPLPGANRVAVIERLMVMRHLSVDECVLPPT
jgi:hypothetical protein